MTGIRPFLSVHTAAHPVYHPNRKTLTFISDVTGLPQVWELYHNNSWPRQLSFTNERIMFVDYLANTDQKIIGMDYGVNEKQQLFLLGENGELDPLSNSPDHIHRYGGSSPDGKWIAWASNRRHVTYFDIYIQSIETREITCVLEGDGTYAPVKWHPSGKSLLIQQTHSNLDNDLGILNLDNKEVTWLTTHNGEAHFTSPEFSKDARKLYVLTNIDREFTGLTEINLETKELKWLDQQKWDFEELAINKSKTKLAYTVNEGGVSIGVIREIATGETISWGPNQGVISELHFSPDETKLAFVYNASTSPPDIWELNLENYESKKITKIATTSIVQDQLVEPELITYSSFDGLEIPAFYYRPKGKKGKLPVVVFVHGGPESQIRSVFNPFLQYFINRGYAVCTPNVRGSSGYGKTYIHLDDVRKRMDSVKDLTYLVDWLKKEGNADPDKIAVMGRSYGGFMVLAAVTHYPDLWAAGIDIVGISSFKTFLKNTSPWRRKLREAEYGSLENDSAFFDEIDPLYRTKDIRCPMMVLHGANDPRVPIEETEQMVDELKARNHPVDYIRFEDEGHFFVKLTNNITAYTGVAQFLDQYL